MKKTLALVLAVACLYLTPSRSLTIKSQPLAASTKFYTVANPIPNQFIVVLATTDLSPIADPAPAATPVSAKASAASATMSALSATSLDSSSMAVVAEPAPDPVVVATATSLTSTYGGSFSTTWS